MPFQKCSALILVLFLLLGCKSNHWHTADIESTNYRFDKKAAHLTSTSVDSIISPYRQTLIEEMSEVIGYSEERLFMDKPESNLGNWVADLLKKHAERIRGNAIDFAIQNYGGLRIKEIPKGPISKGKMFELMPFENLLVIVTMDSESMIKLLDRIAAYGGWPVSEGLQFKIENGKAVDIKIGNEPLDQKRSYLVAMPDYIANGGDNLFFLKDLPKENLGVLVRDLMIREVLEESENGNGIKSNIENRLSRVYE